MSASQEPHAVEGLAAWRDASWWYRAGLALVLCAMAPLLIAPLLLWFHTDLISPLSARSVVSSTSFLEYGKPSHGIWSLFDKCGHLYCHAVIKRSACAQRMRPAHGHELPDGVACVVEEREKSEIRG
jgi:hypothetical protein